MATTLYTYRILEVLKVLDGDTFDFRVDLGFNLDPREFVPGSPERRHVWHFLLGQPF